MAENAQVLGIAFLSICLIKQILIVCLELIVIILRMKL